VIKFKIIIFSCYKKPVAFVFTLNNGYNVSQAFHNALFVVGVWFQSHDTVFQSGFLIITLLTILSAVG